MTSQRYSISQAARGFGLAVSTLRYYDELGLIRSAERRGNVRYYGRPELRRLALVQRLHHRGLISLADTGTLLAPVQSAGHAPGREVLTSSIRAIKDQIAELRSAQRLLEHLVSCPKEDPVRECTHLHAELDRAVTAAVGPPEPGVGA